jgi:4-hydroxythreonine-4-phosphate dehydrogenase
MRSIVIATGDVTGIGPEVSLKALASEMGRGTFRYHLLGDERKLRELNTHLRLGLTLRTEGPGDDTSVVVLDSAGVPPLEGVQEPGSAASAQASLAWLRAGAEICRSGQAAALVTAPVNKGAIIEAGHKFIGQTEYLAAAAGMDTPVMMLLGSDDRGRWLRVALATTHLPLRDVAAALTREKVLLAIERSAHACSLLKLGRARVGVCGLNPHAGENGHLGDEESTIITPAITAARKQGLDAVGPLPADSLFYSVLRGDFDAVVAMYHDQGLPPLKMIAFENGVNWTLGLPFIRTSPDHGTAYDIAGKGTANPSSMIAALRLAQELAAAN